MKQLPAILLVLILLPTLPSCARLSKPTLPRFVPPAGCSERAIALRPDAPPVGSKDWRRWASAYISAALAYEDSETKRAETADCMDKQREVQR